MSTETKLVNDPFRNFDIPFLTKEIYIKLNILDLFNLFYVSHHLLQSKKHENVIKLLINKMQIIGLNCQSINKKAIGRLNENEVKKLKDCIFSQLRFNLDIYKNININYNNSTVQYDRKLGKIVYIYNNLKNIKNTNLLLQNIFTSILKLNVYNIDANLGKDIISKLRIAAVIIDYMYINIDDEKLMKIIKNIIDFYACYITGKNKHLELPNCIVKLIIKRLVKNNTVIINNIIKHLINLCIFEKYLFTSMNIISYIKDFNNFMDEKTFSYLVRNLRNLNIFAVANDFDQFKYYFVPVGYVNNNDLLNLLIESKYNNNKTINSLNHFITTNIDHFDLDTIKNRNYV